MIRGTGQALFEESRIDPRNSRRTNANLAEALIATQADIPQILVELIPEDDRANQPAGMKGLAEIGEVGPAPAFANAVFNATGQRHRNLPLMAADNGGELKAALEVLGLIALRGKAVTADAIDCNRRTVAAINERGGD